MFAPSFIVLPLILLWVINKKIASYFYPFIYITSVFGIMYSIGMILSPKLQIVHKHIFTQTTLNSLHNDTQVTYFLSGIILLKILLILFYPFNVSHRALNWSILLTIVYLISYQLYL